MAHRAPGKHYRKGITLVEAFRMFPDDLTAEQWFVENRWPNGVACPQCGSLNILHVRCLSVTRACAGSGLVMVVRIRPAVDLLANLDFAECPGCPWTSLSLRPDRPAGSEAIPTALLPQLRVQINVCNTLHAARA